MHVKLLPDLELLEPSQSAQGEDLVRQRPHSDEAEALQPG